MYIVVKLGENNQARQVFLVTEMQVRTSAKENTMSVSLNLEQINVVNWNNQTQAWVDAYA
jgi:hypothetical protein